MSQSSGQKPTSIGLQQGQQQQYPQQSQSVNSQQSSIFSGLQAGSSASPSINNFFTSSNIHNIGQIQNAGTQQQAQVQQSSNNLIGTSQIPNTIPASQVPINRFGRGSFRRGDKESKTYLQEIYGPYYLNCEQNIEEIKATGSVLGNSGISVNYGQQIQQKLFQECLENENIWKLYELVIENKSMHSWTDAIFYADKLITLTDGLAPFVYLLGECYFLNGDYKKVHSLFAKYKLISYNSHFTILAAKALYKNKQYEQCLNLLEQAQEQQVASLAQQGPSSFNYQGSTSAQGIPVGSNLNNPNQGLGASTFGQQQVGGQQFNNIHQQFGHNLHHSQNTFLHQQQQNQSQQQQMKNQNKLEAQKHLLKGLCYEASENKQNAVSSYMECLKRDPTCHEAFKRMIDFYLLGSTGKEQLLTSLNFNPEDIWIKQYYIARISEDTACKLDIQKGMDEELPSSVIGSDKSEVIMKDPSGAGIGGVTVPGNVNNDPKAQIRIQNLLERLRPENLFETLSQKNNIDLLCIKAKNCHAKYDIQKAYDICIKAIKIDPLYFDIIPVYCACLLHLNYLGELYYCAHNLVENYSTHPLSWFAIGTYYYLTKKYEVARKYFQKAIYLDRNFVYAWIGMAHSFAIQDESDQAMSFYRTVSRLFPGCYLAHLYMGMEYLRTNNLKTALLSFQYAKEINSNDPLIYNEIGVIYFKQKAYEEAKQKYLQAMNLCTEATNSIVHTILNNLAHTCRKMKDYKSAIQYYERCIQLEPKNYQTYFSLAYTYHISNQLNKAIAYYHKSLYYKHENQFAFDMLDRCLKDASEYPWESVYEAKNE
ncbi:tetratricopeptide repeat protein (macronuclear) [Tetrahymena thermophila SB210]|uniref:Tetratricopeptide repeat protein n=1 Tax=Tetrahymena thermophila (strain SB210) TaxID=312017 RepID=I7MMR4_TETTS|nr:tetratricopeptide repeat protein [Tetrahymena thermophila SB210]EAS06252.1 tetratricopeptide repeat protein [Tetrahymena thermophila SB210]|eukprot:XP_001026497.1 tetratricopeptide repeat protein [Tetrahymena thermophila SB210]